MKKVSVAGLETYHAAKDYECDRPVGEPHKIKKGQLYKRQFTRLPGEKNARNIRVCMECYWEWNK
jgi:hypothetical protein